MCCYASACRFQFGIVRCIYGKPKNKGLRPEALSLRAHERKLANYEPASHLQSPVRLPLFLFFVIVVIALAITIISILIIVVILITLVILLFLIGGFRHRFGGGRYKSCIVALGLLLLSLSRDAGPKLCRHPSLPKLWPKGKLSVHFPSRRFPWLR